MHRKSNLGSTRTQIANSELPFSSYLINGKRYWTKQGVPGPVPGILTGNATDYEKGLHTLDERWIGKYGKTYGMFLMSTPELVSTDVDILRQVLVKDFDSFTDRTMIPIFNECARICTSIIDDYEENGRPVLIKDVITRLTLDMTSKCAFGYNFDVQHNLKSPFIEFARRFSEFDLRSLEVSLVILFPNVCIAFQRITGVSVLNHVANKFFLNVLENLFDDRRKGNPTHYSDFFQILLNSYNDGGDREKDKEIEFDLKTTGCRLSKSDILGQAFMFVLAGFETTPAALHLTLYMLAVHADVQKRCREEVERVSGDEENITYEMINNMEFTEQCIVETLRMYPPVVR
ncbi:unnamed protein product [Heligmosomoides polygyrus]|uniref:Cytochrome P450 n=1 Tax=Heligmosomoides polygyrus TaxID=6339 RepID=A0A183GUA7_HELPZ|nr:unnamed protein product [Heligmosomoides polygyrus]